jgi:hypothetical protein
MNMVQREVPVILGQLDQVILEIRVQPAPLAGQGELDPPVQEEILETLEPLVSPAERAKQVSLVLRVSLEPLVLQAERAQQAREVRLDIQV